MGMGVSAYATSIFFQAMFSDLGWTRGDLALSISIGAILAAILSPFIGTFVDRHGARWIMAISAFATGGCLMLLGYVYDLWQAFIIFSLLAVFRAGFIMVPAMTMVSNWFSEKRGRAMGIMTAGQGLGGFILSPLTIYLISSLGWRIAWGATGILTWLIMIPPALLVVKQKPEDMGLLADGYSIDQPLSPLRGMILGSVRLSQGLFTHPSQFHPAPRPPGTGPCIPVPPGSHPLFGEVFFPHHPAPGHSSPRPAV